MEFLRGAKKGGWTRWPTRLASDHDLGTAALVSATEPAPELAALHDPFADVFQLEVRIQPEVQPLPLGVAGQQAGQDAVQVLGDETLRTIARELVETVKRNSTIDWTLPDGSRMPIEERDSREILHDVGGEAIAPPGTPVMNPAFDVTPARLLTGLITERGICRASAESLAEMFPEHQA